MPFTSQRDSFASYNRAEVSDLAIIGKPQKVERNTHKFTRGDGATVYRLHFTDIVIIHADGSFELNSGGWKTKTTKERINNYIPRGWCVFSDRGIWFVQRNKTAIHWEGGERVPFADGIKLPQALDKHLSSDKAHAKDDANVAKQKKLKKQISDFVNAKIPLKGALPHPSNGDCWYCSTFAAEPANVPGNYVATQSPKPADPEHLLNHVREKYMHGSLIVNALRFAGFRDESLSFYFAGHFNGRVRQALKRYLGRKLGLASH